MTIEEIRTFLEENKDKEEVKSFLVEMKKPTLDDVKALVAEDAEAKKWLQSETDRAVTKGIETWKQNNLDSLIEQEVKKRNPEKSETDLKLEKLEREIEEERKARAREKRFNQALKVATEKGLPTDLVEFFVGDDEDSTHKNMEMFEQTFKNGLKTAVEGKFKDIGRTPHTPVSDDQRNNLKAQYDKAVKEGNTTQAIALKRQMAFQEQE